MAFMVTEFRLLWNTASTFGPASENANLVSCVQTWRSTLILLLFRTYSDRSTLWAGWDELLLETEADAACHADVAGVISRAVSRPLLEKTFHMKIQSRKVFAHRESYETILSKTEEMLLKVRFCSVYTRVFILCKKLGSNYGKSKKLMRLDLEFSISKICIRKINLCSLHI